MKLEQQAQAYLLNSEMHRAEREFFDAWEELTNAIGQKLEGGGQGKDLAALRARLSAAEDQAWSAVDRAVALL